MDNRGSLSQVVDLVQQQVPVWYAAEDGGTFGVETLKGGPRRSGRGFYVLVTEVLEALDGSWAGLGNDGYYTWNGASWVPA